jgi:hypothetical protein
VKKVNLSYNSKISDISVYNLCNCLPNLRHLVLSHCPKITNKVIYPLLLSTFPCFFSATFLTLTLQLITQSLEYLQRAKHLKKVDITGIYSLSKNAIDVLSQSCPNLTIIKNDDEHYVR